MTDVLRSFDPATGELVGEVPITPVEEIPAIVARARQVQPSWDERGLEGRAAALAPVGEELLSRAEELAPLLTREMGKPLARSLGEIRACGKGLEEELAEIVEALAPEVVEDERTRSTVYHDPFGVCAAITPWNYPVAMPHWLVLPALVAGNTVVLKPSEETPLIGQAYAEIVADALPDGALQVVQGADAQGKALVAAEVDLIAFTGSREVGKKILTAASDGLKRVILELGGKDPLLVLADADLEAAASFAAQSSFDNTGQACISTERIFVESPVAERFLDLLVEAAGEWSPIGHGLEEENRLGPMVNGRQRDHVLAQLEEAVDRGARVLYGGEGHRGNFVQPTVLADVTPGMSIAREETFGPVACVTEVSDADEAVRLANDSPFGLGAVVFAGDEERGREVGRRLTAGMVGINRGVGGARGTPWVGARESGYGFHHSRDGHRNFTQPRVVSTQAEQRD
ncbi:MAG: aldehyde dehydrogenase family protein [Thermoanaerobaculia bacterium]|nr:aldehyde dehydrogenase family protein [Thermoanaerobaculia bacterium]